MPRPPFDDSLPSPSRCSLYGSAFVVGSESAIYLQDEDDTTVRRIDQRTCAVTESFTHPAYGEGRLENDQMACDALTFGQPAATPTSVLWIRDAPANVAQALAVPDRDCP